MVEPLERPLTPSQVAERLSITLARFRRIIKRLRDNEGFPQPLPGIGRYDPLAIDRWRRERAGLVPVLEPPSTAATDDEVAEAQRRMDQRAASFLHPSGRA